MCSMHQHQIIPYLEKILDIDSVALNNVDIDNVHQPTLSGPDSTNS